ncbi:MAG: hypothetical protein JXD21_01310 [Candidatus Omnitrophica bacterium]|nr:hypothetical protein [Candidatus Omnitrophota bacterium]
MITVADVYAVSAVTSSNAVNKSIAEALLTAMTQLNTQITKPSASAKVDFSQVLNPAQVDIYV